LGRSWLEASCALELNALLADGEIAVVNGFRDGVEAVVVVEVDERPLAILQLVECRGFLKVTA
jgi:hypothetical protein